MLSLYLQAAFAAFRPFTSGTFRSTAAFITPSAAYGLLLNVAGMEMRKDDGKSPMTLVASGLPRFKLALGAVEMPLRHVLFQQLHNYPVGASGKDYAPLTKGSKYNIAPVKRELLSNIKASLSMEGDEELEWRIREGLAGRGNRQYGLPFLGDNNFLVDRLEIRERPEPAYWYEVVTGPSEGPREGVARFTVFIDRQDMSRTRSLLMAPNPEKTATPPDLAWVEVGY